MRLGFGEGGGGRGGGGLPRRGGGTPVGNAWKYAGGMKTDQF